MYYVSTVYLCLCLCLHPLSPRFSVRRSSHGCNFQYNDNGSTIVINSNTFTTPVLFTHKHPKDTKHHSSRATVTTQLVGAHSYSYSYSYYNPRLLSPAESPISLVASRRFLISGMMLFGLSVGPYLFMGVPSLSHKNLWKFHFKLSPECMDIYFHIYMW